MKDISFRQQRYDEKQKKILENAARLFAQKGFGKVSLEEIGAKLKLSKASLYHYVKSKDDILFQLHLQAMDQIIEVLDNAMESDMAFPDKFKKVIRDMAGIATKEESLASYRLANRLLPQKMRPTVMVKRNQVLESIHKLIQEGLEAGLIHCRDWKISVFAALGAMNWIPLWYSPKGPLSVDEIAQVMEEFIFRGFGITTDNRQDESP